MSSKLIPPFTEEAARAKVKAAQAPWNRRDPRRVALAYTDNRISVRFEWRDESDQWYRTHATEPWEFYDEGLMRRREVSANDVPIAESERRYRQPEETA